MKLLFGLGILFLFCSCKGQKKTTSKNEAESDTPLILIASDDHSNAQVSETLVITDYKALQAFYSKINSTRKPGLPLPKIDFTKEMLVVSCSGERSGATQPTLEMLEETDTKVVIASKYEATEKKVSSAITSPFSIYKMPLTEKQIIFEPVNQ